MTDLLFLRSWITMPWPMGEWDSNQIHVEILLLACLDKMVDTCIIYLVIDTEQNINSCLRDYYHVRLQNQMTPCY